jgi:hypothetical protein
LAYGQPVKLFSRAKLDTARPRYPVLVSNFDAHEGSNFPQVGLCSRCLHMREIRSDRGSTFYMCQLSATDPRFPKYPRLPVLQCLGYQPSTPDSKSM